MPADKEDSKKIYEAIKKYLPVYALFQSDRKSNEDDQEIADPMKLAVKAAIAEVEDQISVIKDSVQQKATETAMRTLDKLREMNPDIADSLTPEFKAEPKFDSAFKLTIKSDDNIPLNKRDSGVRRLILLNFFRAEAEHRLRGIDNSSIIYAFEEPETSQHPNHQEILLEAFYNIAHSQNSQVILTTHTPTLAGKINKEDLRLVENNEEGVATISMNTDDVYQKICDSLGILPSPIPLGARALLLVEGRSDVIFINHTAQMLKDAGYLEATFVEKGFAIIPIGGCGNLKHWNAMNLANQFRLPWCVLIDSDKGTVDERIYAKKVSELIELGIKAYATRKREPENYIHNDCFHDAPNRFVYDDICDVKKIVNQAYGNIGKDNVLDHFWVRMTSEQIREVERYECNGETRFEFTEMFLDFLSLV